MKVQFLFLLLIVMGFLISCDRLSSKVEQDKSDDENEIINIVFDKTVGSDIEWKSRLKSFPIRLTMTPPDGFKTKKDKIEFEKTVNSYDSLKALLDTAQLHVFVDDTSKYMRESIKDYTSKKLSNFKSNFFKIDTSFQPLVKKLIDSAQLKKLNLSRLKSHFKYKVDYESNRNKYPSNVIYVGTASFSTIAFNNDKTKACIYSDFVCGRLCGGGEIIFLTRKNKKWVIVGESVLWVA